MSIQNKLYFFIIPEECTETSPLNPCDFFDNLDFPMDIFSPPQKPEFLAGISNNISNSNSNNRNNCGCGCGCGCSNNVSNSCGGCGCK